MSRLHFTGLLLAMLLVSCAPEPSGGGQLPDNQITVAFWNVENLLDQFDDPALPHDEAFPETSVRERMGKDAEVIRHLNADILGLAEVENRAVLNRLVKGYLGSEGYKHVVLIEGEDSRGIDVALLSRFPCFAQSVDIEGLPRDMLACRFSMRGQVFYVVVNHWKSRRDGGGEDVRLNGGRAMQQFVTGTVREYEGKAVPVIAMGDFNDEPEDASFEPMRQAGMVSTMKSLSEEERWTLGYYDRDASRMDLLCFDQIWITPELQQDNGLRWVRTEVVRPRFMVNDRRQFDGVRIPLPLDDYRDRIGYSDHYPVKATFAFEQ